MQSATTLLVVETLSALIPTGLLIMMAHWRMPRAFPVGDHLAPFRIHALDVILSVTKSVVRYGSWSDGGERMVVVAAT